jgi:hypothetical protein
MNKNAKVRRTTVTLEPDVSAAIRTKLRERPDLKEKTLINELLRKALEQSGSIKSDQSFSIPVFGSDLARGVTPKKVLELIKEI